MKQVLEDLRDGSIRVEDVPAPAVRPGFVLVANACSLISSGTEGATVKLGRMGLLAKARARPDQAMKVVQLARAQGMLAAYTAATRALEAPVALGYSSAGTVLAVGDGVEHVAVGDRVSCGGQGFASHAEIVGVPKHLCVPVPDGVEFRQAAYAAVGAIAMQSLRVADVRIGERIAVVGLGLIGCLVAQLLRAAGCSVLGIDIDPRRVALAQERGWATGVSPAGNVLEAAGRFSAGHGVDAVIVTASTDDNGPVELAGQLCRRKGRVVVLGRTPISAPRETYLFKELSLLTSMALGPGTGDPVYELEGIDYPLSYVRWTEQRNMAAFLAQVAEGRVDLAALTTHAFPVAEASSAFELVTGAAAAEALGVLLTYAPPDVVSRRIVLETPRAASSEGVLRIGVVGAGAFAGNELLPLLAGLPVTLRGIASATGVRSAALGRRHGFAFCTSDPGEVIDDPEVDAVLVLTRHDTHAALAARALGAGRHVFVEKPLALHAAELDDVERAWRASGRTLMVGFNRRYAPLALRLQSLYTRRAQPLSMLYRFNVGHRPREHWLHHPAEGGGVILGEACHAVDFCHWLAGSRGRIAGVVRLGGEGHGYLREDNVHMALAFEDGSIATIAYVSNGSRLFPVERIEITGENRLAVVDDWRRLQYPGRWLPRTERLWLTADKGHARQLRAFVDAALGRGQVDTEGYLHSSRLAIDLAAAVAAA